MKLHVCLSLCLAAAALCGTVWGQSDAGKMPQDHSASPASHWYDISDVIKTDESIEILYNIDASAEDEYEVGFVLIRDSDPKFRITPKQTDGKIGVGSFAGRNNSIVWKYKNDVVKDLKGNDYRIELTIRKIEHTSSPWLWIGVGAAAAGTAAAVLLGKGKGSDAPPGQTSAATIPPIGIPRPN